MLFDSPSTSAWLARIFSSLPGRVKRSVEESGFGAASSAAALVQVEAQVGFAVECLDWGPQQRHRYWHVLDCSWEAELVRKPEELADHSEVELHGHCWQPRHSLQEAQGLVEVAFVVVLVPVQVVLVRMAPLDEAALPEPLHLPSAAAITGSAVVAAAVEVSFGCCVSSGKPESGHRLLEPSFR